MFGWLFKKKEEPKDFFRNTEHCSDRNPNGAAHRVQATNNLRVEYKTKQRNRNDLEGMSGEPTRRRAKPKSGSR